MKRGSPEKLARNDLVRQMYATGRRSQVFIADYLEISRSRVRQILHGQIRRAKKIEVNK